MTISINKDNYFFSIASTEFPEGQEKIVLRNHCTDSRNGSFYHVNVLSEQVCLKDQFIRSRSAGNLRRGVVANAKKSSHSK